MHVTVDIKGEGTHEFDLEEVADGTDGRPTYAALLRAVDLSPHEVSVLVDGRPVPEDQPVESEHVTVLRLIKGGCVD
ncbi:ubiquitin-like small modifier protein SAMP2 [Natronolimnobius baerhuensis]|uniref:Sulfur transfer protein involved in thiamine biosynthesis n=1 Tax=Natronolimnobius baerhuensis TaxID=253108 RepID=A0A202E6W8_9EURY|nr:ubiquitin-like small modifier protein 2 [Natronolimnobius baerhuensis]OVE84006.1 sulfur transfer protein involved in thiamine biosynthesis [Natronolimnobius baerhuensis]